MSGWQTLYLDTGTEAAARDLAAGLGSALQPRACGVGGENCCFLAYTPLAGHDDATWSFAVLSRFDTDRAEGRAACNAVLASPYVRTPVNPSNVWAA